MNNYTYDETVVRAYLAMDKALKIISDSLKMVVRQQTIINNADREMVEELKRRSIPTPDTIIRGL